jgi:hypothetical protein
MPLRSLTGIENYFEFAKRVLFVFGPYFFAGYFFSPLFLLRIMAATESTLKSAWIRL